MIHNLFRADKVTKIPPILHLLTAAKMLTVLLFIMLLASTSNQYPIRLPRSISSYQLIHKIDSTTEMTGSITLCCRDSITADTIPLSAVHFWLNWTTINDLSLRERTDITVTESTCDNDDPGIQFNLTHHLDGYYTCGRRTETPVLESSQETLICKWNICLYITESRVWLVYIYCSIGGT